MRKPFVFETDTPILRFTQQEQEDLRKQGVRLLQITVPMLQSINRKYSNAGGRFHTNGAYLHEEQNAMMQVVKHVEEAGWQVYADDVYLLFFDFSFSSRRGDIDGPRKSHGDILKPRPSGAELKYLNTPLLKEAWYTAHPPAIINDNRIQQEVVTKHLCQVGTLNCVTTIYAFAEKTFRSVPLHQLVHQFLLEVNEYKRPDKKGW